MVISRLITTVSWGPNCPSFNLRHCAENIIVTVVPLSMWQLMRSMASPLNIQASSGLLQLFPTIQLPPCSTKELKTHRQSHKDCLQSFHQKLESTRSASFRKSRLFQKAHGLEKDTFNLGRHGQIPMGCDAKCKQTDSRQPFSLSELSGTPVWPLASRQLVPPKMCKGTCGKLVKE